MPMTISVKTQLHNAIYIYLPSHAFCECKNFPFQMYRSRFRVVYNESFVVKINQNNCSCSMKRHEKNKYFGFFEIKSKMNTILVSSTSA